MHTVKDLSTSAAIKRGYRVEVAFASGFVKGARSSILLPGNLMAR